MKLKSIDVSDFRRFKDLRVRNIPKSTRLIVLAGPNGCGKSSLFDALLAWRTTRTLQIRQGWYGFSWEQDYHGKVGGSASQNNWQDNISVETFDAESPHPEKAVYARSAYRNDPEFVKGNYSGLEFSRLEDPFEHLPVRRMIDNDASTSKDYWKLVGQTIEGLYAPDGNKITKDDFAQKIIGDIRNAFNGLFPNLRIDDLSNPFEDGTFRFTKGNSKGFLYKNLSGGEKAVFDLILDFVVASRSYDDTLYCIDEPEGHLSTKLQARLLSALYGLLPENCQLILATHSFGIMRQALDIEKEHPNTVTILDFADRDFDQPQTIEPTTPSRTFWKKTYEIALDDLAALVLPETVVICEGAKTFDGAGRNHSHDERCYEAIFAADHPEAKFISSGNDEDVIRDRWGLIPILSHLFSDAVRVIPLIDQDLRTEEEIEGLRNKGVRVLSRRNLEAYLLDDEVLQALAVSEGCSDQAAALLEGKKQIISEQIERGDREDLKKASGSIYNMCKKVLALKNTPGNSRAFLRDTLAPLVRPGMKVYAQLDTDIFGF